MTNEPIQKYARYVVFAILAIIALYFSTQVLLLSSLPTDPRRAPDVHLRNPQNVQFIAVGHTGDTLESRMQFLQSIQSTCENRGCDFLFLLGDLLPPHGMSGNRDPKMDKWVRDVFRPLGKPIYAILGTNDYGSPFDRQVGVREVRWATRTKGFEMPSSNYFFRGGAASFWAFDTSELIWGHTGPQTAWLTESLGKSSTSLRIGFGHHGMPKLSGSHTQLTPEEASSLGPFHTNHICGAFDLFISTDSDHLSWTNHCGTSWIYSGSNHATQASNAPKESSLFASPGPGYIWVDASENQIDVELYDKYGKLLFSGTRNLDGSMGIE